MTATPCKAQQSLVQVLSTNPIEHQREMTILPLRFCNIGDSPLLPPYSINFYVDSIHGTPLYSLNYADTIGPGDCVSKRAALPASVLCDVVADSIVAVVSYSIEAEADTSGNHASWAYDRPRHYHSVRYDTIAQGQAVQIGGSYFHRLADTTLRLTATDGCDSTIALHLVVQAHTVSNDCEAHITGCDSVLLISHPTIVTLGTSQQATYYRWLSDQALADSTSATQQFTIAPGETRQFIVRTMYEDSINLVFNGDFELGNVGFTTQYRWVTTSAEYGWHNWGIYSLSSTPFGRSWFSCARTNPTTYFVSDASEYPNVRVYETHVSLSPNTLYAFSARFTNVYTTQGIELQFYADTAALGPAQVMNGGTCEWRTLYELFNSGPRREMSFYIIDNSYFYTNGNDIALDDVNLRGLCTAYDTLTIRAVDCTLHDTIDTIACDQSFWLGSRELNASGVYDTVLLDHRGCDNIVHLILTINHNTAGDTLATVCDSLMWHDSIYRSSTTAQHTMRNTQQCDSLVTLRLTVHYSQPADTTATVCDSLCWRGHTYYRDTHFVHPMLTIHQCDSTQRLDLTVHYDTARTIIDTFCEQGTYLFNQQLLDSSGTYVASLRTVHQCDSIVTLHLGQRQLPADSLYYTFDCHSQTYTLHGITDQTVYYWACDPPDLLVAGHERDSVVKVMPYQGTLYRFYAAYPDAPACLTYSEVFLAQPAIPHAVLSVQPRTLNNEARLLSAYDQSQFNGTRQWFVNGEPTDEFSACLRYEASPDDDTLTITLRISNDECSDSATVRIPVYLSTLYIPNVFTPELPSNNLFGARGTGLTDFSLAIYNRTGQQVFFTRDLDARWDGTYGGNNCPQGIYTYIAKYKDRITPGNWQHQEGTILLVR